jgi:phosphate starvation-inducible protein PhoH
MSKGKIKIHVSVGMVRQLTCLRNILTLFVKPCIIKYFIMSKKHRSLKKGASAASAPDAGTKDKSKWVFQNDKLPFTLDIRERNDVTDRQQELIDIILDKNTKVVFISGPAGTSKTWCALYAALQLLNRKTISDVLYTRTIIESASKSLGSLPGELGSKIEPFMMPLHDKLQEFLPKAQIDALLKDNRVQGLVVNHLRGASFNAKCMIFDEAQNALFAELVTAITRIGQHSKLIFVGDPDQSDINGRSGFQKMYDLFNDDSSKSEGIHTFNFTKEDIVRSGVLRYICERIESAPRSH